MTGAIGIGEAREVCGPSSDAAAVVAAFDDQFAGLFRAAYRVAFRISGSREEAADCAQEACARAYADWKKLQRGGDVTPWVVRVSGNLAIDRWRKARRRRDLPVADEVVSPAPDRVDLAHALEQLPRRQRDVVVLRYIADMTEPTVAEALGCSVGTVKTHASRGLAALRAALEPDEEAKP